MNKVIRKSTGIVLGLTLALLSGAPALADDTELLLVSPPSSPPLGREELHPREKTIQMTSELTAIIVLWRRVIFHPPSNEFIFEFLRLRTL